jgi:hypothetical protein
VHLGNFGKVFKFEQTIREGGEILPKTDYVLEYFTETLKPLSLIEWHCNITEYSYANDDSHPHLHKHDELLYVHFIDNDFYENPLYKETCTKIMFIPLRKGLQEIKEIALTPLDGNSEKTNLKNVTVYLHLKEE